MKNKNIALLLCVCVTLMIILSSCAFGELKANDEYLDPALDYEKSEYSFEVFPDGSNGSKLARNYDNTEGVQFWVNEEMAKEIAIEYFCFYIRSMDNMYHRKTKHSEAANGAAMKLSQDIQGEKTIYTASFIAKSNKDKDFSKALGNRYIKDKEFVVKFDGHDGAIISATLDGASKVAPIDEQYAIAVATVVLKYKSNLYAKEKSEFADKKLADTYVDKTFAQISPGYGIAFEGESEADFYLIDRKERFDAEDIIESVGYAAPNYQVLVREENGQVIKLWTTIG